MTNLSFAQSESTDPTTSCLDMTKTSELQLHSTIRHHSLLSMTNFQNLNVAKAYILKFRVFLYNLVFNAQAQVRDSTSTLQFNVKEN